ncbi:type 1 glutamine amidotransferase domain-containing protein [Tenacibaculum agarivorans]|uniref:type 1 glutamine amidotransferase domain-containing protein n=1 Tax=Tenacibaculum agarivorans TaxID=1908389 RepID=UPI00094BBEE2|nr:type 1 glutamine amidotransferase domain-containing protein [Tenacibaculum agarivorans]
MYKTVVFIFTVLLLSSCNQKEKVLFITSNQHSYGTTTINTANHFGEIVYAYDVFVKKGYQVDFVSPKGGAILIGDIKTSDSIQKKYVYNEDFMNLLKNTFSPDQVTASKYKAIYYPGGGAAMFGIADHEKIQKIAKQIYNRGGVISAVCHGTAGISSLKDNHGNILYAGKKISGYPDLFENTSAKYYQTFPFSIERKIKNNGGDFVYSTQRNDSFYIESGNFITGQDPSSTKAVAEAVVKKL